MKVAELSGVQLDWAVCKANGEHQHPYDEYTPTWMANRRYSEDWAKGGPIIEREKIELEHDGFEWWARIRADEDFKGSVPLIAAMRCYVASKLGDEIDLPVEIRGHEQDCPAIDGFGCKCEEEVK
jgi:hypothetical protein